MSDWVWLVLLVLLVPFGTLLFRGAPYVPTLHNGLQDLLKRNGVKKGESLLDVGSGDGAVLKLASNMGLKAIGIEINPVLVLVSNLRLVRVSDAKAKLGNMWKSDWPPTDIVYVFQQPQHMSDLEKKILETITKPTLVVSHEFEFEGRKPIDTTDHFNLYRFTPLA